MNRETGNGDKPESRGLQTGTQGRGDAPRLPLSRRVPKAEGALMAQILMIKTASLSLKDNRAVDDIVGIFPDSHVFSDHEKAIFTIKVEATDQATLLTSQAQVAETREAYRAETTEWTLKPSEIALVWRDGNDWKEVVTVPRFPTRYEDGQIKENYSKFIENDVALISEAPTKEG